MARSVLKALLQKLEDVGHDEEDGEESAVGVAVVHRGDEGEEVDQDGRDAKGLEAVDEVGQVFLAMGIFVKKIFIEKIMKQNLPSAV